MRSPIRYILMLVALLGACSRDTDEWSATSATESADADRSTITDASPANPSFADWRERLDELLPLAVAAQAVNLPVVDAETKYQPGLTLEYRWPSDRVADYAGLSIPVRNRVKLGVPNAGVTASYFRSRFAPVTDDQRAALERKVEQRATKQGLDQTGTDVAKALIGTLSKRYPTEDVDSIADDAVWELHEHGQTLHLLHNRSSVTLQVDISADPAINKAAAIDLARTLIARL